MIKPGEQKTRREKAEAILGELTQSFSVKHQTGKIPELSALDEEDYLKLRQRAIRYLATDKGRSATQVMNVLQRYFPEISENKPEIVELVIKKLIEDHYLDEFLCGRRLIKRHSGRKQKSRSYLLHLLREQGLSKPVIDQLASEILSDEITAENYFYERLKDWDFTNPEKIARHFASRGYAPGIILKIMTKYANE